MFKNKKITKFLVPGRHVHLVGIGGVSMRPLGLVLKGMGMIVTGSDMSASAGTEELENQGIPVAIGHHAENQKFCNLLILKHKCQISQRIFLRIIYCIIL